MELIRRGGSDDAQPRDLLVVGAVALATSLVMVYVISSGGSPADGGFDPYYFGEMGRSIAAGDGFKDFGNLIQRRAPLYPLMIGGVYWMVGEHPYVVLFVHCLFFTGTALLAYDLGRRLYSARVGVIAGVLCAVHPLLLRYVPSLHLEAQLTFLTTLMVWCAVRFALRPSVVNGILLGVTAGLAALTKAVVVVYPIVFLVALLLVIRSRRRRGESVTTPWKAMIAVPLALGLTIVPWTIRNYGTTGHFVLISSGTSDAFLRGFLFTKTGYVTLQEPPYTGAENESNDYFRRLAEEAGTEWERDDYETDQILNDEALRRLREEPLQVARKSAIGLFTFWYQLTSLKNSLLVGALAVAAWAFALVGWRRARREGRVVWPLLLPVLYLNVLLALLLALGRYSAPILPALLVVAAYGIDSFLPVRRPADA